MQREKLYDLHNKVYCNCFEKNGNSMRSVFTTAKVRSLKTLSILKKKVQLENKWSYGNCRAFHAASYGIFWLLIQCIKRLKTNLSHTLI